MTQLFDETVSLPSLETCIAKCERLSRQWLKFSGQWLKFSGQRLKFSVRVQVCEWRVEPEKASGKEGTPVGNSFNDCSLLQ